MVIPDGFWAASAVIVPALFTFVGGITRSDRRPRGHKRLLALAELWEKLPSNSVAQAEVGKAIDAEGAALATRELSVKPINRVNVGLTTFFAGAFGLGCYLLLQWVLVAGEFAWLAWSLFAIAVTVTLVFVAAAVATWRNPPASKASQ